MWSRFIFLFFSSFFRLPHSSSSVQINILNQTDSVATVLLKFSHIGFRIVDLSSNHKILIALHLYYDKLEFVICWCMRAHLRVELIYWWHLSWNQFKNLLGDHWSPWDMKTPSHLVRGVAIKSKSSSKNNESGHRKKCSTFTLLFVSVINGSTKSKKNDVTHTNFNSPTAFFRSFSGCLIWDKVRHLNSYRTNKCGNV